MPEKDLIIGNIYDDDSIENTESSNSEIDATVENGEILGNIFDEPEETVSSEDREELVAYIKPESEEEEEEELDTSIKDTDKEKEIFKRTGLTKGKTYFRNGVELPTRPGMTGLYEVKINTGEDADRFANDDDIYNIIGVLDSIQQDAFKNPYKYGVGLEDAPAIQKLDMNSKEHRLIKSNTIDKLKEITGLNISEKGYDVLYNSLAESNKNKVEAEYEINKIKPGQSLNPVYEKSIASEFDEGKPKELIAIESYNEKQFYNTEKINSIDYKIEQAKNNNSLTSKEKETTITSLEEDKNKILNENKSIDSLIKKEAVELKDYSLLDVFTPVIKQVSPFIGSIIESFDTGKSYEELTSKFFNERGLSEENSKEVAKKASGAISVAGIKAQDIINENPKTSQREALKQIYDNEALYLQQLESEGREKYVELDISKVKGKESSIPSAWVVIKNKGLGKYEDLGDDKIKISYENLRSLGIDSRDFEGWYDSMLNMADDKTIASIKSYNEEIDETMAIAMGYRNLWRNNVDVGAIEKPSGVANMFQQGLVSTLGYAGLSDKEAKEFITGDKEGLSRDRINTLDQAIQVANSTPEVKQAMGGEIDLTDEQKENIDVTLTEEVSSGVGAFLPDLVILGATGGTMNALGYSKLMSKLSPMMRFATGAAVEEAKMQTILDMKPGGGAAFYTLGQATAGLTPFKKRFKWMDPLFQKVIKSGPIGAISAEGAAVSELAYDSFMGDKNFKSEFDKMYKNFDEVGKRLIVNSMVFSLTGFTHVKKNDFRSTNKKYSIINKLQKERDALLGVKDVEVIEKDGVVIPDKLKPKKTYNDLNASERQKFNEYSTRIKDLNQQVQVETMYQKLNPDSENFERDFNELVTNPMNKGIKAVIPEFEGVKVRFGKGKDFRRKNFQTNEKGEDLGNTAQYNPETGEMFFDLNKYTAGKPVHEFTHAATEAYFKANPTAERNFTKRMSQIFKDFDFGELSGTELETRIKEVYGTDLRTIKGRNLTAKEYLAFMGEIMADPKVYYTNPKLASNFMNEFRLEIKDILIESGLKTPTPKTAKDMVELMALLGKSTRMGTKLDVKIGTLAKLDEIDILGTRLIEGNREAEANKVASKDLTKEVEVSKTNKDIADKNTEIEEKIIKAGDTKVRDIQNQELAKQVKKELSENNIGKARQLASQAAKSTGAMALEPSKRVSVEEFRSGYEEQLARLIETYKPVVDGKRIPFGAYMQKNLKRRYGQILQQAKKGKFEGQEKRLGQERAEGEKEFDVKSEEATPEEAIIASEEKAIDREGIVVSKRLKEADKVVSAIRDKIPTDKKLQEEFLKDKTYKTLKDLAAKETQEMFGIKPKPGNLTKSDVRNAQMFINKNPDLFYSLLPNQHTTKRVNIGTKNEPKFVTRPDKATGVQNVLLEAFYNKGTRKDNLTPWTKKPARDVSTAEFLELFGVTERGNPNLYVKNTNVSARIKALVEQTGRIITNQTVREVIPEAVEVGRGKAETMASKEGVVSLKLERDGTIIKSVNDRVRKYKVDPIKVNKKSSERIQEALLGDVFDVFSNFLFQGGSKFQFAKSSVMSNSGNLFERAVRKGISSYR